MGYVLSPYIEYRLITDTVVQGQSHQANRARTWTSPTTYYRGGNEALLVVILVPFPPFLSSAIFISHKKMFDISEILFFLEFYWCPPYYQQYKAAGRNIRM